MQPIFELTTPRDEVLQGELSEDMFAARLKDVMRRCRKSARSMSSALWGRTWILPTASIMLGTMVAEYRTSLDGTTPEQPFALHVQPIERASTDFALILRQRVVERSNAEPHVETLVTLDGDNLRAVADQVLEALRKAEYKVTDLSSSRRKPFYLPEETGVRLGLVFLTVKPLTKARRVEAISQGIRQMPSEEAYYWYSKCTAAATAERAQRALRVLLAEE